MFSLSATTLIMNFYQHHIGDYIAKTQGLNDEQSMTYLKLIWEYMQTEKCLPLNIDILVAKTGRKKESIEMILSVYFMKTDEGFVHDRCESEIKKYTSISETRRKVALQQHKSSRAKAVQKHSKSSAIECKPITNNHKPITNIKKENIKEKVLNSKNSLTPCTDSELIELSIKHKITLQNVRRTHELLLNRIADGEKKYKTIYRTLSNWLIMGLQRGTLQEVPVSMLPSAPVVSGDRPLTPEEEENIAIMQAGMVEKEPTVIVSGLLQQFKSSFKSI